MRKQDIIEQWFELHGPGLKAKGVNCSYDFDTDTYTFYREVKRTGALLQVGLTSIAIDILRELEHG